LVVIFFFDVIQCLPGFSNARLCLLVLRFVLQRDVERIDGLVIVFIFQQFIPFFDGIVIRFFFLRYFS
jgi:hypothetical protein